MIKHKMKLALWNAQGRACAICFGTLSEPRPKPQGPHSTTKDHVTPRSAGGGLVLLAHRKCNNAKGNRPPTVKELLFLEATIAALEPRAMRDLLDSCVQRIRESRERAALAQLQISVAEKDLMMVLRYASTEQAAKALARIQQGSPPETDAP